MEMKSYISLGGTIILLSLLRKNINLCVIYRRFSCRCRIGLDYKHTENVCWTKYTPYTPLYEKGIKENQNKLMETNKTIKQLGYCTSWLTFRLECFNKKHILCILSFYNNLSDRNSFVDFVTEFSKVFAIESKEKEEKHCQEIVRAKFKI